tara:strand:- start:578 stop:1147 length:570 start_codon:yes stop_codon:yes gene_type:complete
MKLVVLVGLIALALILSGCIEPSAICVNGICETSGNQDTCPEDCQTPSTDYVGADFSVKYPLNWSKATDTPAGAIFVPEDEMSVLMVSKLSGVEGTTAGSLNELIEQLLSPLKKTGTFSLIEESSNYLNGVAAKDITFSFEEEGELVNTRIIAAEKNGAFYLLALSGPEQQFNRDLPLFEETASSFKFQ